MKNLKKFIATILATTLAFGCIGSMGTFGTEVSEDLLKLAYGDIYETFTQEEINYLKNRIRTLIDQENLQDSETLYSNCVDLLSRYSRSYDVFFSNQPLSAAVGSGFQFKTFLEKVEFQCYRSVKLKEDEDYYCPTFIRDFKLLYSNLFVSNRTGLTLHDVVLYNYCSLRIYLENHELGSKLLIKGGIEFIISDLCTSRNPMSGSSLCWENPQDIQDEFTDPTPTYKNFRI